MTNKKEFGLFIQSKRKEKKYSQKDLAEILFVTESAVSKWERGVSYPDITLLSEICKALDVSEYELINASNDTVYRKEKKEAKLFRRINGLFFWIPTTCYGIALLACFIVNLAVDHKLSWFCIVLTALLCAFSFIPTFTAFFKRFKLLVFTGTSLLSICLLLITIGLVTGLMNWVGMAIVSIILGYEIIFAPMLLNMYHIPKIIKKLRFLITAILAYLLTVLLFGVIYSFAKFNIGGAFLLTSYCFIPVLLACGLCLLPLNKVIRTGASLLQFSIFTYLVGNVVSHVFPDANDNTYQINYLDWQNNCNGNVQLIIFIVLIFISVALLATGIIKMIRKQNEVDDKIW